jgi:hypothetical protein
MAVFIGYPAVSTHGADGMGRSFKVFNGNIQMRARNGSFADEDLDHFTASGIGYGYGGITSSAFRFQFRASASRGRW